MPQRLGAGPNFFIMYINVIGLDLPSEVSKLAGDTKIGSGIIYENDYGVYKTT